MAAQPDTVRLLRTEILHWFQGQGVGDENLAAAIALATSEAMRRHRPSRVRNRRRARRFLRGAP